MTADAHSRHVDSAPRGSAFDRFSKRVAGLAGRPRVFAGAVALIAVWLVGGPLFGFSDTWQLVINTATTIVTFLMVFVIQNTQNRDGAAIQIKLDELLRVLPDARNRLLDLEDLDEDQIEASRKTYLRLAEDARDDRPEADIRVPGSRPPGPPAS